MGSKLTAMSLITTATVEHERPGLDILIFELQIENG